MDKKVKSFVWFIPAAMVFAAGFAVGAVYDLDISTSVYQPHNLFAVIMEAVGWFPAFIPVVVYSTLLAAGGIRNKKSARVAAAGAVVAIVSPVAMLYKAYNYFKVRGIAKSPLDIAAVVLFAVAAVLFVLFAVWALRMPETTRARMIVWSLCGSVLMAGVQVATTVLKIIWQRTRFDEMMLIGNFDFFTPWYRPFGHGGSSFPSGHTANMACVLMLVVLCDLFPAWAKKRKTVYLVCWVCIMLMGISRVLIGRHFLSDVLAGSLVTSGLFFLLRKSKVYYKVLDGLAFNKTAATER